MKRIALAVLMLSMTFFPGMVTLAQEESKFDGIWVISETELIIEIGGSTVRLLSREDGICYPVQEFELDGNQIMERGLAVFTLEIQEGNLAVFGGDEVYFVAEPAESPESVCPETIEVAVGEVSSPEELDAWIRETWTQTNLPGLSVAVVVPGKVLWSQGYGLANIEIGTPATPDTPYLLASVTKVVTGTAVLQTWQEGKLDLDAPVNNLLPFVVDNPYVENEVITVRHLATHTSSIIDNYNVYDTLYSFMHPEQPVSLLGEFLEGYLTVDGEWYDGEANFAGWMPETTEKYSNVGAALAGYLVEVVTGTSLDAYAQAHIFQPLGMVNTSWNLADFEDENLIAMPYYVENLPYGHFAHPTWPDGMLRSSANDMGRFLAMIANGGELDGVRILDEATVIMALQPQFPDIDPGQGFFWMFEEDGFGHNGGDYGVSTLMYFNTELGIGVIVLINSDSVQANVLMSAIPETVFANAESLISTTSQ